jgi:phosphoserine phosphatase
MNEIDSITSHTNNPAPAPTQQQTWAARAQAAAEMAEVLWQKYRAMEAELRPEMDQFARLRHEWYEAHRRAEVLKMMGEEVGHE